MKFIVTFILSLALVYASPIKAQETGTIYGTVVDRQNGDPLMGATIFLEGTNWGTLCDLDGSFRLMDIPVGKYVLIASMIGYQKVSITGVEVTVVDGKPLEVTLSPEAIELDEEVVVEAKALRNTGASLLKERQKAPAISDAISAEEISRSGSGDAAEAMKQTTGASVVGENTFISAVWETAILLFSSMDPLFQAPTPIKGRSRWTSSQPICSTIS